MKTKSIYYCKFCDKNSLSKQYSFKENYFKTKFFTLKNTFFCKFCGKETIKIVK